MMRVILATMIFTMFSQPVWASVCRGGTAPPEQVCDFPQWRSMFNFENRIECLDVVKTMEDIHYLFKKRHTLNCSTTCQRADEIIINCEADKLPDGKINQRKIWAVEELCAAKACNPSILDKMRY